MRTAQLTFILSILISLSIGNLWKGNPFNGEYSELSCEGDSCDKVPKEETYTVKVFAEQFSFKGGNFSVSGKVKPTKSVNLFTLSLHWNFIPPRECSGNVAINQGESKDTLIWMECYELLFQHFKSKFKRTKPSI
eukprot:TRINITY_DN6035_c0_g1_i1.p1 TRINITY_DN6035_c0_g1~~TRINITY_DN6035_c0_g1_i1.p1  ORF type:complete len:135 (+),score=40.94 TRINITY_DN6035_c0_g1_i1:1-405(+)